MILQAIIADDLSGSCDAAATFIKYGYKSCVLNYPEGCQTEPNNYEVLSISTNSRESHPVEAEKIIRGTCDYLKKLNIARLYKKIDSTWRGNIGVEIETLMREMGFKLGIVCSAFPSLGRTVNHGHLLINGVPISRTPFVNDPTFPVRDSYIPALLRSQTNLPVEVIDFTELERGKEHVRERLLQVAGKGESMVLFDARDEGDLRQVAAILGDGQFPPHILCGSAGLINSLVEGLKTRKEDLQGPVPPCLIVVGSTHPQNFNLISQVIGEGMAEEVYIDPLSLLDLPDYKLNDELWQSILVTLQKGTNLVIRTRTSQSEVQGEHLGLSSVEFSHKIALGLGSLVQQIVSTTALSGLIITGGTTAFHILKGLGFAGIELAGELEPGVPYGKILNGKLAGMGIVTKAGGFGSPNVFTKGIEILTQQYMKGV